MKYTIKKAKYGENKTMYIPVFNDDSLKLLEEFLMTEVKSFKKQILKIITDAEDAEFAGNVCLLHIQNGVVRIECAIDGVDAGNPIELEFQEFAQAVNAWISDTQKSSKQ